MGSSTPDYIDLVSQSRTVLAFSSARLSAVPTGSHPYSWQRMVGIQSHRSNPLPSMSLTVPAYPTRSDDDDHSSLSTVRRCRSLLLERSYQSSPKYRHS